MSSGYIPPPFSAQYAHVYLGYVSLTGSVSGAAVTIGSGSGLPGFATDGSLIGAPIYIENAGGSGYPIWETIASVTDSTHCTLSASVPSNVSAIRITFYRELKQLAPATQPSTTASSYVRLGSIDYESSLTTRPTLNFDIVSIPAPGDYGFFPQVGQPVLFTHDTYGWIFGGSLDQVKVTNYPGGGNAVMIACQCVSWDNILTRRLLMLTGAFSLGAITQNFTGDGTTTSFTLTHYPSQILSVTLNGVSQTVGASGAPGNYLTWYFDVYVVTTATAPPAGQILSIQYNPPGGMVQLPIYTGLTADQIAFRLADTMTSQEIMPIETLVGGPLVNSIQFTTQDTVDSALQSLCNYINNGTTNYWYFVDSYRGFYFEIQGVTRTAPWHIEQIDLSDGNVLMQLTVTISRDQFANAAWADIANATGGTYAADEWQGDGSTRSFTTTYAIASVDDALGGCNLYNGSSWTHQTVGLTGTSGSDWYYTEGSNTLTQDAGGTTLTSSEFLQFLYFPSVAITQLYKNTYSIIAREQIEGTSGEYDLYIDMSDNNPVLAISTVAQNNTEAYSGLSTVIEVITYRGGLVSGQGITVSLPQIGIAGNFVVDQVKITDEDGMLKWDVTLNGGAVVGGWKKAMVRLADLL